MNLPVIARHLLVMVVALPIILGLYELVVQQIDVLRVLFGLKALAPVAPAVSRAHSTWQF